MNNEHLDLVIAGIGNQPLAYACFVLARMAQNKGLEVQILEPAGSPCKALAHVRIARKAARTPIAAGEADVLLGLEPADAIKALPYLKKGGLVILNAPDTLTDEMLSAALPGVEKPLSLLEGYHVQRRDALTFSRQLGMPMALVTVLLGVLSNHLPFTAYDWQHAIGSSVPRRTFGINMQAFDAGRGVSKAAPSCRRSLMDEETDRTKKDDECSDATM